ncbi:MAG: hypothetical protein HYV60_09830 [Planctomycetia bacterium]|nr:hypothetical protein [Planctomycetia bacterium]
MIARRGAEGVIEQQASDPQLDSLLRSLIQKTATAAQVQEASKAIEAHIADKPAGQQRIGDTARRLIEAGRLDSYGTPPAQAQLKVWAEKYPAKESQPK